MKKITLGLLTLIFSVAVALPAMAQGYNPVEMGSFENFLNAHPDTARELQQNPNLINNPQWMSNHHGLQQYMSNHPNVRAEVHQNPGGFVNNGGQWGWNHGAYNGAPGAQASRFDQGYLNEHPEVSQQLARNPGLADNPQYLAAHPGLNDYLQGHPNVRYDLEHHPDRFMSRADQGSANYHGSAYPGNPGWNGEHHQLGTADNYFDHHPDVYQEMQKDPRLVDNQHYVDSHPGLHDYLEDHPHARQTFKNHPDAFMHAEEHYDQHHHNH
jgi:hypothetical protein